MIKGLPGLFLLFLFPIAAIAQSTSPDTTAVRQIEEVTVHAFGQTHQLLTTPAAMNAINATMLARYGTASIVQAVNALPGVRMEERSPGSYRFNIRGSSLRSPFGVRNVKVYYNDIPFTDPGGTTYLNQLGYYNIASLDILKGPGSSIYGAGTGGVILLHSFPDNWQEGAKAEVTAGSYGLLNAMAEVRLGNEHVQHTIRYQHLESDGYRNYTAMHRDVVSWDGQTTVSAGTQIRTHFLYSDLAYETPGALTLREYDSAPRMARPTIGNAAGSEKTFAAIYQKMFLAGFSVDHAFGKQFKNTTTLYGVYAQLYNPSIRNYAKSSEPNVGGRTVFTFHKAIGPGVFEWLAGAEFQQNFTTVQTYQNNNGHPDTLQTDDILRNGLLTGFTQLSYEWKGWSVTGGLSISQLHLLFARVSNHPYQEETRHFNNELSPRLALLKKWNDHLVTYATVARGFSPPVSTEISPSGSALNLDLQAEYGWNYELGLRGYLLDRRFYYDASAFYFALENTIVQRRDAQGGDYYINSGSTEQMGAEVQLRYDPLRKEDNRWIALSLWGSYTWQHFKYRSFIQGINDYSGNKLPGIAPHTIAAGIDIHSRAGVYLNLNYYYSGAFSLNDANTDFNTAYHVIGARAGYALTLLKKSRIDLFAGVDNLGDEHYSAGPDINAFGGRYYNASPGRTIYGGLSLQYIR